MAKRDRDEYLELAESQLEEAVSEWNETGEIPTPDGRLQLAKVYALTSIARALHTIADREATASRFHVV